MHGSIFFSCLLLCLAKHWKKYSCSLIFWLWLRAIFFPVEILIYFLFSLQLQILPYDQLMQELDVSNVRELEDFLINECMYSVSPYILIQFRQFNRCVIWSFFSFTTHLIFFCFVGSWWNFLLYVVFMLLLMSPLVFQIYNILHVYLGYC